MAPDDPNTADTSEGVFAREGDTTLMSRAGTCTILGLPNVGKSTLLNYVLGLKLVAVSPKPNTTRNRVVGVVNRSKAEFNSQIVFVDTPGIQRAHNALRRYMRDEALTAAIECDVVLLMLDASDREQCTPDALDTGVLAELGETLRCISAPIVLALNKVDRVKDKAHLLPMLQALDVAGRFTAIVPICARRGQGVDDLLTEIGRRLPPGPPLYPPDMYTDRPARFLAAELVREQLFLQLAKELPYSSAVVIEEYSEREAQGDMLIRAAVVVERDSQKGIVVGKGGSRIKEVGQRAREEIARLFGRTVHLTLFVKVDPDWSHSQRGLRRMGYES